MQLCCSLPEVQEASCSFVSTRMQAGRCSTQPSCAWAVQPSSRRLCSLRAAGSRSNVARLQRSRLVVKNTYPEPETEKERSTLDFPQEWITPQPSRRPDIFPEFEKLETPMPKPLPGDPELPEDEEEEEKEKKEEPEKDPEEEPDKEQPPPEE